jgi:hypothetical protein
MSEEEKQLQISEKLQNLSAEERRNFVGFFELLLRVDKRVNPHLYKLNKIKNND